MAREPRESLADPRSVRSRRGPDNSVFPKAGFAGN